MPKTTPFDAAEFLDDPNVIIEYLLAAIEDGDIAFIKKAAETVRRARSRTEQVRPIANDAEHTAALAEIRRLWGAAEGTADSDKLDILATLVEKYESKRWPAEDEGTS